MSHALLQEINPKILKREVDILLHLSHENVVSFTTEACYTIDHVTLWSSFTYWGSYGPGQAWDELVLSVVYGELK